MKTRTILPFVLLMPLTCFCQGTPSAHGHYTHSELKRMIRVAHTPDDFKVLANYFSDEEQKFRRKANEEKNELDRRLKISYPNYKIGGSVDSARGLFQYYCLKANESGQRAESYRLLAKSHTATVSLPTQSGNVSGSTASFHE